MKTGAIIGNVMAGCLMLPVLVFLKVAFTTPGFSHWGALAVWIFLLTLAAWAVRKLFRS